MHPSLDWELGGQALHLATYDLFIVMAALATLGLGLLVAGLGGLPGRRVLASLLLMALAAFIGARLLHAATSWDLYLREPGRFFHLDSTGFSLFGGLLLATATGWLACRFFAIDPVQLADCVAPALGVGIALAKLGCYGAGCCFGELTTLPWGVTFPFGSQPHLYHLAGDLSGLLFPGVRPVHPIQLYESVAALAGAILAAWLLRRQLPRGTPFLAFALWFAAFRLMDHPLRAPSLTQMAPEWFYPLLYIGVILAAGVAMIRRSGKPSSRTALKPGHVWSEQKP